MQFEYEISPKDYVACQDLYYRLTIGTKHIWKRALGWTVLGLVLIFAAWGAPTLDWGPVFLAMIGTAWVYGGIRTLFPARYFRRHYSWTKLAGKKFNATVNEEGIRVAGEFANWSVQWDGLTVKGENCQAFMLCSDETGTIFMFGKKYLTDEQQQEMRRLAGIATTN